MTRVSPVERLFGALARVSRPPSQTPSPTRPRQSDGGTASRRTPTTSRDACLLVRLVVLVDDLLLDATPRAHVQAVGLSPLADLTDVVAATTAGSTPLARVSHQGEL